MNEKQAILMAATLLAMEKGSVCNMTIEHDNGSHTRKFKRIK